MHGVLQLSVQYKGFADINKEIVNTLSRNLTQVSSWVLEKIRKKACALGKGENWEPYLDREAMLHARAPALHDGCV